MVIRAITLIAVLRLGLVAELKDHAYRDFVKLPLYLSASRSVAPLTVSG